MSSFGIASLSILTVSGLAGKGKGVVFLVNPYKLIISYEFEQLL